jgi:hypothetical protein
MDRIPDLATYKPMFGHRRDAKPQRGHNTVPAAIDLAYSGKGNTGWRPYGAGTRAFRRRKPAPSALTRRETRSMSSNGDAKAAIDALFCTASLN